MKALLEFSHFLRHHHESFFFFFKCYHFQTFSRFFFILFRPSSLFLNCSIVLLTLSLRMCFYETTEYCNDHNDFYNNVFCVIFWIRKLFFYPEQIFFSLSFYRYYRSELLRIKKFSSKKKKTHERKSFITIVQTHVQDK